MPLSCRAFATSARSFPWRMASSYTPVPSADRRRNLPSRSVSHSRVPYPPWNSDLRKNRPCCTYTDRRKWKHCGSQDRSLWLCGNGRTASPILCRGILGGRRQERQGTRLPPETADHAVFKTFGKQMAEACAMPGRRLYGHKYR